MQTSLLLELEKKYGLNHLNYNGFAFWTYGRFQVIRYLDHISDQRRDNNIPKETWSELLRDAGEMAYNCLFRSRLPKKGVELCIFNHERRVEENGYYECVYTERIAEHYPSCVVLERPYGYRHMRPVKTKNLVYYDGIEVFSYLRAAIAEKLNTGQFQKAQRFFRAALKKPIEELEDILGMKIDEEEFARIFTHIYLIYRYRKNGLKRMIKRISPRAILEVVSYNVDCMIVNETAKEMCIPTIELQHGTMGEGHIAYNYNLGEKIPQFPDKIFLFSEYWRNCTHLPLETKDAPAVGFPYFENKVKNYLVLKQKRNSGNLTILFVSQWIIGKELSDLAVALYNKIQGEKIRIIYKLHPGEYADWRENYPSLAATGIEVVDSLKHNIYEYFAISDIQVGVFSTAIYEGLGFGLRTYIYQTYYAENIQKLCDLGYAKPVRDAEELFEQITKGDEKGEEAAEQFWEKNALENIYRELDAVLQKG